jgi:GT2 family glycosyltransferase
VHNKNRTVSVVIATLGGEFLELTLSSLNSGSIVPSEILICIPNPEISNLIIDLPNNARLVEVPSRGQVAQRSYGLGQASGELVLQLDDDVLLQRESLQLLIEAIENTGSSSAVSPIFINCKSGKYLTEYRTDFRGILQSIYSALIGGASWGARRMGTIDRSGIPYAIDARFCNGMNLVPVDWLPGGCVITRRENLVLDNYFPFKGKAFCEDVIHSLIWRARGVSLWIAPNLAVCTHISAINYSLSSAIEDYRARVVVVSMNNGSLFRCRLRLLLVILRCATAFFPKVFRA